MGVAVLTGPGSPSAPLHSKAAELHLHVCADNQAPVVDVALATQAPKERGLAAACCRQVNVSLAWTGWGMQQQTRGGAHTVGANKADAVARHGGPVHVHKQVPVTRLIGQRQAQEELDGSL